MIARPEQRVVGEEDPLLGRRQREHVVGARALVAARDRRAQLLRAGHLGVAEAHRSRRSRGVRLEREQLVDGSRLAVAAREHELGAELPALVEALDRERPYLHALIIASAPRERRARP